MNIFKRLLKIGQAEIHALVEKMENPIALIDQGLRDLREEVSVAEEQYAVVRASILRNENLQREKHTLAKEYEQKAKRVLEKAKVQEVAMPKAEELAYEALIRKNNLLEEAHELDQEITQKKLIIKEINNKLETLRSNISKWEKELTTIKTKEKISSLSLYANKQMSVVDSNSTVDMLERLKNKAKENEALAEAYAELAHAKFEKEMEDVLDKNEDVIKELDQLKGNLGL